MFVILCTPVYIIYFAVRDCLTGAVRTRRIYDDDDGHRRRRRRSPVGRSFWSLSGLLFPHQRARRANVTRHSYTGPALFARCDAHRLSHRYMVYGV